MAPTVTGGLREGEEPIRLVMCRLADDAAASVIELKLDFSFYEVGEGR